MIEELLRKDRKIAPYRQGGLEKSLKLSMNYTVKHASVLSLYKKYPKQREGIFENSTNISDSYCLDETGYGFMPDSMKFLATDNYQMDEELLT